MDEESELYDVNSPEFFEAFMRAMQKVADDDRRMGLLANKIEEKAA